MVVLNCISSVPSRGNPPLTTSKNRHMKMKSENQQPSKAGHTQGPWASKGPRVYQNFTIYGMPSSKLICSCYTNSDYTILSEQNANAQLIATAPELLAELTQCIDIMVRAVGERLPIQQGTHSEEQDWENTLRKARAIIARATGTELEVIK